MSDPRPYLFTRAEDGTITDVYYVNADGSRHFLSDPYVGVARAAEKEERSRIAQWLAHPRKQAEPLLGEAVERGEHWRRLPGEVIEQEGKR